MSRVCARGRREVVLEVCAQELEVTQGRREAGFPLWAGGRTRGLCHSPTRLRVSIYAPSQDRLGTFGGLLCFEYEMRRWRLRDTPVNA